MKRFWLIFSLIVVCLPAVVWAQNSTENVFIPKEQTITYNFIKTGDTIDISGTLNKDAYVLAETVVVDGVIEGDLIGVAETLTINGTVKGNLRFVAGKIMIKGEVGKNFTGAAESITVLGKVGQDIMVGVNKFDLQAEHQGDINLFGVSAKLNQKVGGNLFLHIDPKGSVEFSEGLNIGGNLEYSPTRKTMVNFDSLQIAGQTKQLSQQVSVDWRKTFDYLYLFSRLFYFFGLLVLAMVMLRFMKKITMLLAATVNKDPLKCFNHGFWWLILVPIVSLLLFFTMIGMPLGLIAMGLYAIAFYSVKVFVALAIGSLILKEDVKKGKLFWPMILGVFIVVVAISLPFVGFLVNLIISTAGFGALYLIFKGVLR